MRNPLDRPKLAIDRPPSKFENYGIDSSRRQRVGNQGRFGSRTVLPLSQRCRCKRDPPWA